MMQTMMTLDRERRRLAAVREEIRRIGQGTFRLRLLLSLPLVAIAVAWIFQPRGITQSLLSEWFLATIVVMSLTMETCLAYRRRQARRLLASLTREEQREVLAPLRRDLAETDHLIKPLLREARGGSPSPGSAPEGRGDEPAAGL